MAKALVYKATSDDTKDPSGFVLKELAQLSYVSTRECSTILEQLLKRLDKDKPDVKYKALRTIKYMCIHGRAEFRQELQRDNGLIKMCLHYKGPADPLRGDTPNQRVRDEAKECTNAIFNTTGTGRPGPSVSGRLEGFGSNSSNHQHEATPSALSSNPNTSSYSHGTYSSPHEYGGSVPKLESGAYSTGKMVGFGSSENTVSNSSSSILSKVKNRLTGTSDEIQRPTFKPYDRTPTYESPQPAYDASATRRQAGAPGGVWGNAPAETLHSSNGRSSSSNHYGTVAAPPSASRMTNSTGEYESRLVDQITAPTGVRPTPLKEELTKFTQQCESLDKFMIAGLLDAKLGSTVWQQQMKSLCVLESLLQTGSEEVEDYLCEHSGHLEELEHATNPQLKSKARRVLELCGLREEEKAVPSAAASYAAQTQSAAPVHHHQQQPATVNLLDFTDTPAPSSNELSLFDAPAVAKPAHAPAPAPAAGGFDFISGGTTTSSSAAVDDTSNLFGNMQIKATPAPATSSSSSSSSSSIDLFANTNIKTNPTPAPAATSPPSAFPFTQSTSPPPTTTPNNDPLAFLSEPTPSPATKSDPVAHLLATSSQKHPQPAYNAYQPPPSQAYPPYGAQPPYGTQPPYGYSAPPTLGYPPHGYPPHPQGYPPHAQPGYPAPGQAPPQQPYLPPFAQPAKPNPAKDFTFHVQAASTNQRQPLNLNGLPELGHGTKPTSATTSSSFGFIAEKPADSFGFVNDMLKS